MRIGQGYDVHRIVEGRPLFLGGVLIPWGRGLLGHSDADVLLHAIMDAVLGACGMGDIGTHFPDTDEKYAGADSKILFAQVVDMVHESGMKIVNIDCTVIAQEPKLSGYIQSMREKIAEISGMETRMVNVKATTEEKLGFTGSGEGMAAMAVCLLENDE